MGAVLEGNEDIKWTPSVIVSKYSIADTREMDELLGRPALEADFREYGVEPEDYAYSEGNALTTVGLQRLGDLFTGASAFGFTASRGMMGVGDSSTANSPAVSPAYTALLGTASTGQFYVPITGAASSTNGLVAASANFTSAQANYQWNEWCWAIATAAPVANSSFATATTSGVMLNRKVQNLGTKASGATWTLSASVQFS